MVARSIRAFFRSPTPSEVLPLSAAQTGVSRFTSAWSCRARRPVRSRHCGSAQAAPLDGPAVQMTPSRAMLVVVLAGLTIVFGCVRRLQPHPAVPAAYGRTVVNASDPTPEAPALRYRLAYESFWWNCVALKADDENAPCPFACSGTAAAAAGCAEGAMDSENMVRDLIRRVGAAKAKDRLHSRVAMPDAQQSIRRYFPSGLERERISPE
jgi:hypothetical protein